MAVGSNPTVPAPLLWADPSLTARPPHRPFPSWVGLPPGGRRQPLITAWWRQCLHSALPAFQHSVNSPCGARSVCSTHCGVLLLPHPGGHAPCSSVLGYIHLPWWASDAIGQGHVCPLIFASPCLAQSRAHETTARTNGLWVVPPPSFLTARCSVCIKSRAQEILLLRMPYLCPLSKHSGGLGSCG